MWYAVNLLFESCHAGQPPEQNLWEERIVLLDACSEAAAKEEAERLGKADEPQYTSGIGDEIRWRFRGVERVVAIDAATLESGTEVFSRFLHASEVSSMLTPFQEDALSGRAEPR
jgi:hypothetical protein